MSTNVSSERGCFISAMLLLARAIILIDCVGLAIVWLCLILSDDWTDILGNHRAGTSLVEKIAAGFMLAICFTGIRAAFTRDEKRLKIVSPLHQLTSCLMIMLLPKQLFLNSPIYHRPLTPQRFIHSEIRFTAPSVCLVDHGICDSRSGRCLEQISGTRQGACQFRADL